MVSVRGDGRFLASADIGGATANAVADTPEAAVHRLRSLAPWVRGKPLPYPVPLPRTRCAVIGEGREMQCVRPGTWPEHIEHPPAVEPRCTACDALKAEGGDLDRIKAEWDMRHPSSP